MKKKFVLSHRHTILKKKNLHIYREKPHTHTHLGEFLHHIYTNKYLRICKKKIPTTITGIRSDIQSLDIFFRIS